MVDPRQSPGTSSRNIHNERTASDGHEKTGGAEYSIFSRHEKVCFISFTSFGMVVCMMGTNSYLPVLPILEHEYRVTPTLINLTITVFNIIQGIVPALMSTLSDLHGRRLAWILALSIYIMANIGLALQKSYVALIILRCLQSVGSSCAIPFGFAFAADIASPAERGRYIGPMHGCVMAAFAFGPVIGGLLASHLGWRSVFWFLAISSGCFFALYVICIPETARTVVGNGSLTPHNRWRRSVMQNCRYSQRSSMGECSPKDEKHSGHGQRKEDAATTLSTVFRAFIILKHKEALILIVYTSLLYFGISALWATTANNYGELYQLSTLQVGLSYLPFGIAGGLGSAISGRLVDLNYRRISRNRSAAGDLHSVGSDRSGDFPIEVARLQIALPHMFLVAVGFAVYGWMVEKRLPLVVPLIWQGIIGLCGNSLLGILYTLLIDLFPGQAAAASGAADFIRCWLGALSAALINDMLSSMGWGWCFTLIGLLLVAMLPLIALEYIYGMSWRQQREMSHSSAQSKQGDS
ncbi:major facilitator superfamily domain-containing protein [Aspergillus pseudotamarii]|uniref:Major facilitator superfamily domain-containing protein n=1 Tax=Aspergillus pseudotamarii TaxID=132259 RepID=A0A5N6SYS9_ASPPS|nr:major facilitator superfamily domain-containing protein [Aspergillus pseudotamarii]KAE8139838.1 major facilitator superfamily domain-containing protein [Aspergillus pseudotamarii]